MLKKILGYTLLTLLTIAGAGFGYLYFRKPASQPPASLHVAATPERVARGKYLFALADCDGCHSPHDESKLYLPVIEARRGSGQRMSEEGLPGAVVASNITPDRETGIGAWTEDEFVQRFKNFDNASAYKGEDLKMGEFNSIMPWSNYSQMTEEDLRAMYAYLMSVKPIQNKIDKAFVKQ